MAAQTNLRGATATLISTGLNSLANNALVAGAAYTASGNYLLAEVELNVTFGTGPTTGGVSVWFIRAIDDANPTVYEDGSSTVTPAKNASVTFGIRPVTTAQKQVRDVMLPPGTWIPLLKNDGTAVAFASSGNTLKITPYTIQ